MDAYLYQNTTPIFTWVGMIRIPESWMRPYPTNRPSGVLPVPRGPDSPHQPKAEWRDKFKGQFDMGWEKMREQISPTRRSSA